MKYKLYIVQPCDIDLETFTLDDVAELCVDSRETNELHEMLNWLLWGLNTENISDQNYYFLVDDERGIIINDLGFR
jgi:hypothetical protein